MKKTELRQQAEAKLGKRKKSPATDANADTLRLIHELEVHQIELEMQNDELVRARREAEAEHRQFMDLYDFAPVGYFTLTRDGAIQMSNLTGANLLGAGAERGKLVKRRFGVFVSVESRPAFNAFLEKVFSTGNNEDCDIMLLKEGHDSCWVHLDAVCSEDRLECRVVMKDVTARKQADELLHKSALRNSIILNTAIDGFWITDPRTQGILEVNEAYCRMSGYSREELLQMTISQVEALEKYEDVNAHIERVKNQVLDRFETIHRRKDGSTFDVELSVQYLSEDGKIFSFLRDITARKQMEMELKERERRLRETNLDLKRAEAEGHIGNWKWNLKTSTVEWSDEMFRIFGIDRDSYSGRLGDVISKVIHPDDLHIVLPSSASEFASNHPQEYRIIRPTDGAVRHIWAKAGDSIFDEQGNPVFLTGVAQDITERKHVENALQESESLYRLVSENAADVIWKLDPIAGKFTYISPSVQNLRGYTPVEVMTQPMNESLTPDSLKRVSDLLAERIPQFLAQASGTLSFLDEVDQPCRDGSIVSTEVTTTYLRNEQGGIRIVGVSRDITERKQAEQELRLHSKMLENIAEGVYLVRASDGMIMYANPQFEKMFGYDAGELVGSNVSIVNAPTDKSPAETAKEIMEGLKKDGIWKGEVYNIKKDGTPFWCHANVSEFDHADFGKVWVSVHQDISERRQVEQEILQLNEHLEKRVQERTVELVRANQVKDEFLAMMSHELRTPLGSVLGFSETLLEGLRGQLNERQQVAVRMIRSSGEHLLGVINDVLDISKIQAKNFVFYSEKVDVHEICKTALVFINHLALQKTIEVEYIPPEAGCVAIADPKRLKQILVNLLSNAVKFTPKNGKVKLEVTTEPQAKRIRFSVTDSGIGIGAEDLPKLFQPFVQLDSKLSRQYEGAGLGLVLVRKLVEMHGGSVEVQSEVGAGSCFTFFLPWEDQDKNYLQVPVAENEQNKKASSNRTRILIADDDPATIMLVRDYLEDYGYQVFVAEDGGQVIPKVEQVMPEVILMDIQMPYVNGLELTRRLRSDLRFAAVPIIALTAFAMSGDRERCLEAGMSDYLSKPVILKELKDLIERLLLHSHK
jgi:two-component system sensor histidine kinase/response regulator